MKVSESELNKQCAWQGVGWIHLSYIKNRCAQVSEMGCYLGEKRKEKGEKIKRDRNVNGKGGNIIKKKGGKEMEIRKGMKWIYKTNN